MRGFHDYRKPKLANSRGTAIFFVSAEQCRSSFMANQNNLANPGTGDPVRDAATREVAAVLQQLRTSPAGLSGEAAAARLETLRPERGGAGTQARMAAPALDCRPQSAGDSADGARRAFVHQLLPRQTGGPRLIGFLAASVMLAMVALGVSLRFVQETRAGNAAAKLKAMIKVTATVLRDGQPKEIPLQQLVPGDVVKLSAGDMIPGDVRLLAAKDLFIIQATLTGESLPVEKTDARDTAPAMSRPSSTRTSVSSARAWKAARPRRSSWPPARRPILAKWPAASPASRRTRPLTRA